ncbi:hypothetical protein [Bacillus sp. AFS029533]|nr:hypothetical protein [Bacillus sp. AFS029533]
MKQWDEKLQTKYEQIFYKTLTDYEQAKSISIINYKNKLSSLVLLTRLL